MDEYIERGMAIAKLTALEIAESCATLTDAKRLLADMPAADVEPVVRCGSCRHYSPDIEYCEIHSHFVTRDGDFCYPSESSSWKTFEPEDYCSQGERRTNANEPGGS